MPSISNSENDKDIFIEKINFNKIHYFLLIQIYLKKIL